MLIADRFLIAHQVGDGGDGLVYKAFDLQTQRPVAIKFLHGQSQPLLGQDPLLREARYLSALDHPGIASYVTHGQTAAGMSYLALEWIDGESLASRLLAGPLAVAECLCLLRKIAEPLAAVHALGIVHCDLKPANLLLRDGRLDKVTLIDFGAARDQSGAPSPGSAQAELHGTAGYLAPEMTRGVSAAVPATDIFSLGCILYECLTGAPAFVSSNVTAILAKILFAEVTPVRQLRPEVPEALESLVLRMLAKDPQLRPRDANALARELAVVGDQGPDTQGLGRSIITSGEERLVTVIVSMQPLAPGDEKPSTDATPEKLGLSQIHAALSGLGAQIEKLADRSLVVAFPYAAASASLDTAERALRSALLLKAQWPEAIFAVATGRGRFPQKMPMGEAVERAARLLTLAADSAYILTDELTYRLVGAHLDIRPLSEDVFAVYGESDEVDLSRPLLGQPTPCVGREPELALLEDTLRTCMTQRVARAVIVTGPPGGGKSRLRHEFLRRTSAQGHSLTALFLRGDQLRAGSPFAAIGQALRRLFSLGEGGSVANNQSKILRYLADRGLGSETQRVAELLGEVCGTPFPQSTRLLTARHDPRVMMTQVSQAWVDLLWAQCAHKPTLLTLEDLHHADAMSVALIGTALRELAEMPLMVLALGRPEVAEIYPQLWLDREPQQVRLGTLSRKACERLARHVLGPQLRSDVIARIVEQSGGNGLCLEELIRAVAEHKRADIPHTVLLMLQARLLRLPAEQRRTLRAASLFGEIFWRGGIAAMLGPDYRAAALDETLSALIEQELIERQQESRFPHEQEFRFRHSLVREAALSLLTEEDRTIGHRAAGSYLEAARERDPVILAEHFRRGEDPVRALPYYLAAAEQALSGCDLDGALLRTQQALSCNPSGETLGVLRGVALAAHFWHDDWAQSISAGTEALRLLPVGGPAWCRAAAIMLPITSLSGLYAIYQTIATTLTTFEPTPDARRAYLQAASYVVITSSLTGQSAMAAEFQARVQRHSAALATHDLAVIGNIKFSETVYARMLGRDPWQSYQLSVEGALACQQAGDHRTLLFLKAYEAIGLAELGDCAGAEPILQTAVTLATELREPLLLTHVRVHVEQLQLLRGTRADLEAACESARQSAETIDINPLLRGQSLINLARAQLLLGQLASAETTARSAASILANTPAHLTFLAVALVGSLLQQQRLAEAAAEARVGLSRIAQVGSGGYAEVAFLHIAALALHRDGATAEAQAVLEQARQQVLRRAACIPQPDWRERYLTQVPENQQVLKLVLS